MSAPDRRTEILNSIVDAVGETPCIRLNTLPKLLGLKCEVIAKCEFLNPGGSVKDRIGRLMVLDAEKEGRLRKGDTLVEATSGNTGIAMSMCAAAKGYKMIITMPQKMSQEKERVLKALGATVIRTPTSVASEHPDSLISVAKRIVKENPETHHMLDQYNNDANPRSHYEGTGAEIVRQCGGKVDMVVLGTGTGGTMTGVARAVKEKCPGAKVVGVDPLGSILADPDTPAPPTSYHVEGIGYDFVPKVCDRSLVDQWVKSTDPDSFKYARMLQREEGLLCGGSSGSAILGLVEAAKDLDETKRVVVILPDNVRNYMTKFIDDAWMKEKGFLEETTARPTYEAVAAERDALAQKVAELEAKLAAK